MNFEDQLSRIAKEHGLAQTRFDFSGEGAFQQMMEGDYPAKSTIYAEMVQKAHDFRRFDDPFELLCSDFLEAHIDILDFQIEAAAMVFNQMNLRAILADEVGLGKTIEAGIITKELKTRGMIDNLLVLAPTTLMLQWQDEFQEKFEIDLVNIKKDGLQTENGKRHWIANSKSWYWDNSTIRDDLMDIDWDLLIIDEAHHLRNHTTKMYDAVSPSGKEGLSHQYLLLLTATPIQNDLQELYSLLHLVRPGTLGSYAEFRRRFFADRKGQKVQNPIELRQIVRDNMIRRRRVEVGVDYTTRHPSVHRLEFPKPCQEIYRELLDMEDQHHLAKLTWIQQAASSIEATRGSLSKRPGIVNSSEFEDLWQQIKEMDDRDEPKLVQLREIATGEDRVVVFTEYVDSLKAIKRDLEEDGFLVHKLKGGMTLNARRRSLRGFRDRGGILVSTKTGQQGLNLQFCNVLVNYDLPWNPMQIEQRIGRIHRLGQEDPVYIHTLSYKGTIEDFILSTLFRKLDLFKMSVGEIDSLFTSGVDDDFDFEAHLREHIHKRASLENIRENLEKMASDLEQVSDHEITDRKVIDDIYGNEVGGTA